ncbi:MAG: DNA primase [Opitutales bacterium]|nr:DNA primase [Opitutales bacterium]
MPLISRNCIEDIRNRIDIVDVVQNVVHLKRSGSSYKGLSPFTQEKTPSFFVHPDKQFFYCFSTSTGGDLFRFVQLTEDLDFTEAVEAIANRYGIPIEYEQGNGPSQESRSLRKEILEIHDQATHFYHAAFKADHQLSLETRRYWLEDRKFSLELAEEFSIGFAPPKTDKLNILLKQKGFSMEAIKECGLFYAYGNESDPMQLKPRFRGRLMIPIREAVHGEVIAFTARKMPCTPSDDSSAEAKYINSPETKIFHKSDVLFNLERARREVASKGGSFIMVEGQLDALRCWEKGLTTAIAPQGTSITETQLAKLKRYSDHLEVILDGDNAGQKAALRMLPMAIEAGLEVQFISLPQGTDPDSLLIEEGVETFQERRNKKVSAMHFATETILPSPEQATAQHKAAAMRRLFEIIAKSDSEIVRNDYLQESAHLLGIDSNVAKTDFIRFIRNQSSTNSMQQSIPEEKNSSRERLTTVEADLLYLVLHHDGLGERISEIINAEWIDTTTTEGRLLAHIVSDIQEDLWEGIDHLITQLSDESRESEINMVYALRAQTSSNDTSGADLTNVFRTLFSKYRNRRLDEINRELQKTDASSNAFRLLLGQRSDLLQTKANPPEFPKVTL